MKCDQMVQRDDVIGTPADRFKVLSVALFDGGIVTVGSDVGGIKMPGQVRLAGHWSS